MIARARAITARSTSHRDPSTAEATGPLPHEPADLSAIWAACDGLELADGTRLLARGEVASATAWLVSERALEWSHDLWVIGERDDLVIVRDLDLAFARAGGGVLETATDGLSTLSRVAMDVLGYFEDRLGIAASGEVAPEREARDAAARRDAGGIARAIARGFYPGADREAWHAGLALGAILAGEGDAEGAMRAFEAATEARARSAPRGASGELRAAWRACAVAAEKAGARDVAAACRERG